MPDKWCDYAVCAVRYSDNPKHIEQVKVMEDKGEKFGAPEQWNRTKAISEIAGDTNIITVFKNEDGNWKKGARVNVVTINGTRYLRTDRDAIAADNLGSLPTF